MIFFRAADVERWRKQLEKTLAEVNSEIAVLHDAKESCERALEAKALPHDITTGKFSSNYLVMELVYHFPFLEH